MTRTLIILITLTLMISCTFLPALGKTPPTPAKNPGRDILVVETHLNHWTGEQTAWIICADGSRLTFDMTNSHHILPYDTDLLFFLRTHALDDGSGFEGMPLPTPLSPITRQKADQIRALVAEISAEEIDSDLVALDAGDWQTHAVIRVAGEARLQLIRLKGSSVGASKNPSALQLLDILDALPKD